MGWCSICMKRRLFFLLDRTIKCSLLFVQLLSTENIVRNYRVPEFGRFLKDTWNRYGMVKYMYEKDIFCTSRWYDQMPTLCVCASFIYRNLVRNYGVSDFGRLLKDTWNRYRMMQYIYGKEIDFSYGWNDQIPTRCVYATFIYRKPCEELWSARIWEVPEGL